MDSWASAKPGADVNQTGYVSRVVDVEIDAALRALPAVVLEGVCACGKTSTGREHARSEVLFAGNAGARIAAEVALAQLLAGPEPRLLDVCRADIPQLGPERSPIRVRRLLRSLARNVASEVSQRTLAADVS